MKGELGPSGSVPPGAVALWREDDPMPPGWEWYPILDGKLGPYRVLWERLIGGGECLRPIRKK